DSLPSGSRYLLRINGETSRPDPASHFQPEGVHQASAVVDHDLFEWTDQSYLPVSYPELVMYELHMGTFTPEGTFAAAVSRLDDLVLLGVNCIEIMPVSQFPGERNWGYDGVHPFAVQNTYGGPEGLKRFVDACHGRGLAVVLDVVYNHLGPEGNYLRDFGPYFTDHYKTPWGEAVNFDGSSSDEVRNFFIRNALHWFDHYHIDGLRLDATHAIYDHTPVTFLQQLAQKTWWFGEQSGRRRFLVAESNMNDPGLVSPLQCGGTGMHGVWSDDFHHVVHTLLTRENRGYYEDYGDTQQLGEVMEHGFVFRGQYSPFRKRSHGGDPAGLPGHAFVVSIQNHDQVGNRMEGERLSQLVGLEGCKAAAALMLFSPFIPMLFMGAEYGETRPFLYFVSHNDPDLVQAVRKGRAAEFSDFKWEGEPPDPQAEATFARSVLDWDGRNRGDKGRMLAFYRECLRLRQSSRALRIPDRKSAHVFSFPGRGGIAMIRSRGKKRFLLIAHLSEKEWSLDTSLIVPHGSWEKILDSRDASWGGPGSGLPGVLPATLHMTGHAAVVYALRHEESR
ncbi:MAG: malto-oligosyltrehalose trehalohydrolase, partial [Desulfovibrionales bacterium]